MKRASPLTLVSDDDDDQTHWLGLWSHMRLQALQDKRLGARE